MPENKKRWFTEEQPDHGSSFSLSIKEKLHDEQSPYQRIEIYETEHFGRLMTIDGLVMLTDLDNFIYHEMMTHPALLTHPTPEKVLIVGGGDCGALREVLKHNEVKTVHQVEIDERVTRLSEQFFPSLCESNNDPRAEFYFTNAIQWLKESADKAYDVIIIDSTDPVGPALGLFSESFYRDCIRCLSANGVLIAQSESPLFHMSIIMSMQAAMHSAGFSEIATLQFPQCSYPSGWWSATIACKEKSIHSFRKITSDSTVNETKYYNEKVHAAALALPNFMLTSLAANK